MNCFTTAVIGLGNIGMLYDYCLDPENYLLTHSAAYEFHSGFELIAAVETNIEKRDKFTFKFNKPAFPTLSELLKYSKPDILSICTPFDKQAEVFFEIVETYTPKGIIFEKPLTADLDVSRQIASVLEKNNIKSIVNYIRRFEPGAQKMIKMIQQGEIGAIQKIIGWYSKDITSNACHIIDLVSYLVSQQQSEQVFENIEINKKREEIVLHCKNFQLHLFISPQAYRLFEIKFIGSKGIIDYLNSGKTIKVSKLINDSEINSMVVLDEVGQIIQNDINRYQWYTVEALYQALNVERPLESTAKTALVTEDILSKLLSFFNQKNYQIQSSVGV